MNVDGMTSFNNDNYENDLIVLNFDTLFRYDCHNNTNIVNYNQFNYDIEVNVFENDILMDDDDASSSIFLIDLSDLSLTMDKTKLSVGNVYDFKVGMICNDDDCLCHISGYHSLHYSFSNLVCQITNENTYLSNVNHKLLNSYYYILDGNTFSFETADNNTGEFLKFEWKCTKYTYNNDDDSTIGDGYDCTNDSTLCAWTK